MHRLLLILAINMHLMLAMERSWEYKCSSHSRQNDFGPEIFIKPPANQTGQSAVQTQCQTIY